MFSSNANNNRSNGHDMAMRDVLTLKFLLYYYIERAHIYVQRTLT